MPLRLHGRPCRPFLLPVCRHAHTAVIFNFQTQCRINSHRVSNNRSESRISVVALKRSDRGLTHIHSLRNILLCELVVLAKIDQFFKQPVSSLQESSSSTLQNLFSGI